MSGQTPQPPENWRDMFDPSYHYPEEISTGPFRGRRARRRWRAADRQARRDWVREQYEEARREEPASPVIVLGFGLVLGLAVLGLALLVRAWLLGDSESGPDTAVDAPGGQSPSVVETTDGSAPTETPDPSGPSSGTETSPSSGTPTAATTAATAPKALLSEWAEVFYTRDPAGRDESYTALLERSSQWMTPELVANLAQAGDPTYEELARTETRSRVTGVSVTRPPQDVPAPADTPVRLSRIVRVGIALTPGGDRFDVLLLVELRRGEDGGWLVGTLTGDDH